MKDDEYKCSTNAGITMFGPISRQPLSSYSKRFQPGRCLLWHPTPDGDYSLSK